MRSTRPDIVNYLVAAAKYQNILSERQSREDELYFLRCHTVIFTKVPPRYIYRYLFPDDSRYLPDNTALELLGKECDFNPKEIVVHTHIWSTFFQSADTAISTPDLSFVTNFVKNTESLTLSVKNWSVNYAGRGMWEAAKIALAILQLIVSTPNPKLTSLTIKRSVESGEANNFAASIAPALASYGGLTELHFVEEGGVIYDIPQLVAIIEHQQSLHTISISIRAAGASCQGAFIPTQSLQISPEQLKSWIQVCLRKPSLKELKLSPAWAEQCDRHC